MNWGEHTCTLSAYGHTNGGRKYGTYSVVQKSEHYPYTLRNSASYCVFTYSVYELLAEDGRFARINHTEDHKNKAFWN